MKKISETVQMIVKATRYSFSFCWRNAKRQTALRIVLSLSITAMVYMTILSSGFLFNTVQTASRNYSGKDLVTEFVRSRLLWPVIAVFAVMLTTIILYSLSNLTRNMWFKKLKYANQRETQQHRATLDVAVVRSKKYDDLMRRIGELPNGWYTRISFSQEMIDLVSTIGTFVLFGCSLTMFNPLYAVVIVVFSLPMVVNEFRVVEMWWNLDQNLVPEHKKRSVLERPFGQGSITTFVQALMFNQVPALRKDIDQNVDNVLGLIESTNKTSVKIRLLASVLSAFGIIAVTVYACWSAISHGGNIGTLTVVLGSAQTFRGSIQNITNLVANQWQSAKGMIMIEEELFGMKPSIVTEYPVALPEDVTPEVSFDRVSFTYPDCKQQVLDDVSFTLKPGSKVALVGATGNGKSTIQALLMRHYDPTSGRVLANGVNLKNVRLENWTKIASSLTQDFSILERLVGAEIASSRLGEEVDKDAVMASCRFANFESVIQDDPMGLESQIGVAFGGREFSGGEKQRLALARVHYRRSPVLILDEPDASLDALSAERIIDNIFALQGVTVVLITHHVSRAEKCDHIIVMGKGKIAEQGTHDELMAQNDAYVTLRNKDLERIGVHLGVLS